MANKNINNKPIPTPKKNDNAAPLKQKTAISKKGWIAIIAALLAIAIAGGIILGVWLANREKTVDFWNDNLSKYITISEDDYKNYTIDIPLEDISDEGFLRKINNVLVKNKNKTALYDAAGVRNIAITLGDEVLIWYRGYTIDENGNEVDFEGGCNFSYDVDELEKSRLEIGSGNFIPGFEEALIGKIPNQYSSFEKIETGSVQKGDVIYLSYSVYHADGSYGTKAYERIDLADKAAVDAKYGTGFYDFFVGKTTDSGVNEPQKIGTTISSQKFFVGTSTVSDAYYDMKVEFVTRCESDPLTIDVRFPADYSKEELRGVNAKFDVYVRNAIIYDTPELNEKFITETLKISADKLADYEGKTTVEKYTAMLREEYEQTVKEQNRTILENKMWEHYKAKVVVHKLPEAIVQEFYDSYYAEVEAAYEQYKTYYKTLDDFAVVYLGLVSGSDWRNSLIDKARDITLEKLIFYYIMREEELFPSDDEYKKMRDKMYNEMLDYYIDLNKDKLSEYEGEKYDAEIAILEKELMDYYGESYFKENVYYEYAVEKMIDFATRPEK